VSQTAFASKVAIHLDREEAGTTSKKGGA